MIESNPGHRGAPKLHIHRTGHRVPSHPKSRAQSLLSRISVSSSLWTDFWLNGIESMTPYAFPCDGTQYHSEFMLCPFEVAKPGVIDVLSQTVWYGHHTQT